MVTRVLICGATGMVGKNLVQTVPSKYQLLIPGREELNLLDYGQTSAYLKENKPDIIIHAAGIVGGIQANIADPVKFLLQNTDMGRNLVWAAFNNNIKNVLNLGSSCMYPKDSEGKLKENEILTGQLEPTNEGYALSKIFTQRLCSYIAEQHDLNYKTIIPCNLYGAYDKFDPKNSHMIPAVIRKIHEAASSSSNSVEIWGDGKARREFMFAEDLCEMIWGMIDKFDTLPTLMNIGLGHDYTIQEYYEAIADVVGYKGKFHYNLTKPVGMKRKLVDITLQTQNGYKARHNLKEGLEKTFQHYLQIKDTI